MGNVDYPDILSLPVYCTVCKQFRVKPEIGYWEDDWPRTDEKTMLTNVTILYKLFDIVRQPFPDGSVCTECYDIVEKYDETRIRYHATLATLEQREDMQKSKLDELQEGLPDSIPLKFCILCKDTDLAVKECNEGNEGEVSSSPMKAIDLTEDPEADPIGANAEEPRTKKSKKSRNSSGELLGLNASDEFPFVSDGPSPAPAQTDNVIKSRSGRVIKQRGPPISEILKDETNDSKMIKRMRGIGSIHAIERRKRQRALANNTRRRIKYNMERYGFVPPTSKPKAVVGRAADDDHELMNFEEAESSLDPGLTEKDKRKWHFTAERTTNTGDPLNFMLFSIMKKDFGEGLLCGACHFLINEVDGVSEEMKATKDELESRIDLFKAPNVEYPKVQVEQHVANFSKYKYYKEQREYFKRKIALRESQAIVDHRALKGKDVPPTLDRAMKHIFNFDFNLLDSSESEDNEAEGIPLFLRESEKTTTAPNRKSKTRLRASSSGPGVKASHDPVVVLNRVDPDNFLEAHYSDGDDDVDPFHVVIPKTEPQEFSDDNFDMDFAADTSDCDWKDPLLVNAVKKPNRRKNTNPRKRRTKTELKPKPEKPAKAKKTKSVTNDTDAPGDKDDSEKSKGPRPFGFKELQRYYQKKEERLAGQTENSHEILMDDFDPTKGTAGSEYKTIGYSLELEMNAFPGWHEVRFIQKMLSNQNFDDNFQLGKTRNGNPMLLYRGFLYYEYRKRGTVSYQDGYEDFTADKQDYFTHWVCTQKSKTKNEGGCCSASLATTPDNKYIILESTYRLEHNHPEQTKEVELLLLRQHTKNLIRLNPNATHLSIRDRLVSVYPTINCVKHVLTFVKQTFKLLREEEGAPPDKTTDYLVKRQKFNSWPSNPMDASLEKDKMLTVEEKECLAQDKHWETWNVVECVNKILERKNFDSNVTIVRNINPISREVTMHQMIYKGYDFMKHSGRPYVTNSLICKWMCKKFREGCKARMVSTADLKNVVLDSIVTEHNHPPDPVGVQKLIVRYYSHKLAKEFPATDPEKVFDDHVMKKLDGQELLVDKKRSVTQLHTYQKRALKKLESGENLSDSEEEDRKREQAWMEKLSKGKGEKKREKGGPNEAFMASWNSLTYVNQVLEKKDFDYDVISVVSTVNNCPVLIYQDFVYYMSSRNKYTNNLITKWRCANNHSNTRFGTRCPVMIVTTVDHKAVLRDSVKIEHNHGPDEKRVKKIMFQKFIVDCIFAYPHKTNKEIRAMAIGLNGGFEVGDQKSNLALINKLSLKFHPDKKIMSSRAPRGSSAAYLSGVRRGKGMNKASSTNFMLEDED